MTTQRLEAMLNEKPFRPFSVHTSDGEVVAVKSPEFAWLHPSKRTLFVATSAAEDREEVIDLLHVTKVTWAVARTDSDRGVAGEDDQ